MPPRLRQPRDTRVLHSDVVRVPDLTTTVRVAAVSAKGVRCRPPWEGADRSRDWGSVAGDGSTRA